MSPVKNEKCVITDFGVNFVHHNLTKEHFLSFNSGTSRKGYGMGGIVWLIIIWYVWKDRNDIFFQK